ncbi:MAG: hypothetical protein CW742_00470 [Methanoregula sp.]|nr:YqhA family protein [Methanoregula sp.]PKG33913.1 MAG: hypothetical protein CW742_00470 [Methanoregula sp.]
MFARFYALRYVCIIAIVALVAGSILMFLSGALHTYEAYQVFFFGHSIIILPGHMSENAAASVALIQAVNAFLFEFVVLIFSDGAYT